MKKTGLLFLLVTCLSFSQNKQVLYGFSEIPQSLLLNPGGEVKNNWYFGIPLLSHIHTQAGSSGISIYDVFAKDGRDFNAKLRTAVYKLKSTDFITANQQLEVFSGGFAYGPSYEKDKYISFGMYIETDMIAYFPKDYSILAYEGNHNNINRMFNLGHASFSANVVSTFHFGFNKKINERLTAGIRGKIYSSILDVSSVNNEGTFITTPGTNNIYNHLFNFDLELHTSGIESFSDSNDRGSNFIKRAILGGDLGLGFDVGFTYKPTKQWTVDGSLLDVGFISYSSDVKNHVLEGSYSFEGINPIFPEVGSGQTAEEYWNEIGEEFEELFKVDSTTSPYTRLRPIKLNASVNYAFGEKKSKECDCLDEGSGYQNAVGLQLYAIKRPKAPQAALTAYYYRRLFNGLRFKGTYTIDSYSFSNLGLGLSAHIGGLNFYIMADNLLEYRNLYNAQSVSLQLGFNYIFKNK